MMRGVVGVDEAGRGPLAGPVAVGAVHIPPRHKLALGGLKDSKKLTEGSRELWFKRMQNWQKEGKLRYGVTLISESVIDRQGIVSAIRLGIDRSLKKLHLDPGKVSLFLDGGLKAPDMFRQKTIVRGDETIAAISLASIAAKVTRDRYMKRLAKKYPRYHFEIHKGYGTKVHRECIEAFGASLVHRRTFLRSFHFEE